MIPNKEEEEVINAVRELHNKFMQAYFTKPDVVYMSEGIFYSLNDRTVSSVMEAINYRKPSMMGIPIETTPSFLIGFIDHLAVAGHLRDLNGFPLGKFVILGRSGTSLRLLFDKQNHKMLWRNEAI